jgi:hypothetical protein
MLGVTADHNFIDPNLAVGTCDLNSMNARSQIKLRGGPDTAHANVLAIDFDRIRFFRGLHAKRARVFGPLSRIVVVGGKGSRRAKDGDKADHQKKLISI